MAGDYVAARLKGGSIYHVLPLSEDGKTYSKTAICGKTPGGNRGFMQRSGWYGFKPGTVTINCAKCNAFIVEKGIDV